jgi:hypothetical protein
MTQSSLSLTSLKPAGVVIYSDGVKLGGIYGSKEAAFEAATVAAMFAVRDGAGVQINIPSEGEERNTGQSNLRDPAPYRQA